MSRFFDSFKDAYAKERDASPHLPRLTKGNSKLRKDGIAVFSLVAGVNCPGAGKCNTDAYCFAQNGRYVFDAAMRLRVRNYLASKREDFAELTESAIKALGSKWTTIRIHDSGDFYAQQYVDKWAWIARRMPNIRFYAYTKSLHLDLEPLWRQPNMILIQSIGGKHDHLIDLSKPHARIFRSHEEMQAAGYEDGTTSDTVALRAVRIGLVVHGQGKSRFI